MPILAPVREDHDDVGAAEHAARFEHMRVERAVNRMVVMLVCACACLCAAAAQPQIL